MNKELDEKWEEAKRTGKPVSVGDIVVCDYCNDDYTNSDEIGGIIFGSKAVCPKCTERTMQNIIKYNEQRYIRAKCQELQSFADFVRQYRGDNNKISITKF